MSDLYEFSANTLDGKQLDLAKYRGKLVLVVKRFAPQTAPADLEGDIEALLGSK